MQTRRDQVQAHMFMMSRLASGLLRGEPDAPDTPVSRTTRGGVWGFALAVVIGLVITLYGVLVPGGATAWQKPGTLVIVNETGARYLYANGELHPVLNETSAKLIAGSGGPIVAEVGLSSLAGTPRGAPVGIVGAPDSMPDPKSLAGSTWLACVGGQAAGETAAPQLTLAIGKRDEGAVLTPQQGVLVGAPDGSSYLLWQGERLKLDTDNGAVQALGFGYATAFPVTQAFLNALPQGPDLAAPVVPGRGSAGPTLQGQQSTIGQLFQGPAGDHYLLTSNGLEPLTATAFALLRGDPRTQRDAYGGGQVTVASVGPDDLAGNTAPTSKWVLPDDSSSPSTPPALVSIGAAQSVCGDLHPSGTVPRYAVTVIDSAAVAGQPPDTEPGVVPSCAQADRILVSPGGGAVARALAGGGVGDTFYLITDNGVKYPFASATVAKNLGYAGTAVGVPSAMLGLLPNGPSLDRSQIANGGVVGPPASPAPCVD